MTEVAQEETRFEFGENWSQFAEGLDAASIDTATESLAEMLERDSLAGMRFLDAGSGSGLFSLAAVRMGAERVHSFDYDASSVATTGRLKDQLGAGAAAWTVERGSVLDEDYMEALGEWDVVYSWGVLHHTGEMWRALANAAARVRPGGRLFISIYNDQGFMSRVWTTVKRVYNRLPRFLRKPYVVLVSIPIELRSLAGQTVKLRPHRYLDRWRRSAEYDRGMNHWHDLVDWIGGYPFEVATPDEILAFHRARGFELEKLRTVGGSHGCNEFVFRRAPESS